MSQEIFYTFFYNNIDNTPYIVYYVNMSGKELIKKLEKDGWILERINGSHHILVKAEKTIVVPLHANRDLGKGLLNKLLKEAGLK